MKEQNLFLGFIIWYYSNDLNLLILYCFLLYIYYLYKKYSNKLQNIRKDNYLEVFEQDDDETEYQDQQK